MTAPSVTLRSLSNEETGIDISVPRFQEEEAPLGGISILYEISVVTKLDLFKTRLHRNEDVVQFSIYKAYREVEDLYNKLNKKYPKAGLPPVPRSSSIDKYSSEEKVAALDRFMHAVAKSVELCHSSTFTHFIGINSQRLPSFTTSNILQPADNAETSSVETGNPSVKDVKNKLTEDLSDVFPKVKSVTSNSEDKVTEAITKPENVDLFEEVKLIKNTEQTVDIKIGPHRGSLFDDFEDENLFSTKPTPAPVSPPKPAEKLPDKKPLKKEPEKKIEEENIDDSQIIIKDRKLGDISLFDEQDLGDYVTKEEEALFLVSSNNDGMSKKNALLFSNPDESAETQPGLHENLDDLLNLNPLPISPAHTEIPKSTCLQSESEKLMSSNSNQIEKQPKRPVPLPRKKSLGKSDSEESNTMTRPEVMPRKVFLTKPEVPSKPIRSSTAQSVSRTAKPPVSAKPVLPPKPKPPVKAAKPTIRKNSKGLDAVNANESPRILENQNTMSTVADDLNKLDILKYIEQEQKTLEAEPSLFD